MGGNLTYTDHTSATGSTTNPNSTNGTPVISFTAATSIEVGRSAHSEGSYTNARGNFSHAEGGYTVAYGGASHAEGYTTIASGAYSHAEGAYTTTSGIIFTRRR